MALSTGNLADITHGDMLALEAESSATGPSFSGGGTSAPGGPGGAGGLGSGTRAEQDALAAAIAIVGAGLGDNSAAKTEKTAEKEAEKEAKKEVAEVGKVIAKAPAYSTSKTSPLLPYGSVANIIVDALKALGFTNAHIQKDNYPGPKGFRKVWHEGESGAPSDTWYGWDEDDPRITGWLNGIPYGTGAPKEWYTDPSWSPGEGVPGGSSDQIFNPHSDPDQFPQPTPEPPPSTTDVTDIGSFDPFASNRRAKWYHPILNADYTPGPRPSYVRPNVWSYTPPPLRDWTPDLVG